MHELFVTSLKLAASLLVPLLALGIGLALRVEDLRRDLKHPVLRRTLLVALLAVPALAIVWAILLPLGLGARSVLVLMAVSPGAPMLMNASRSRSGNVSLGAALAVLLTVGALAALPVQLLVLNALLPPRLHASAVVVMRTMVPLLIIPLNAGAALRFAWPEGADLLTPVVRVLFSLALALVAVAALATTWRQLGQTSPWDWLAMLLVTLGAVAVDDFIGGRDPRNRSTSAYAAVLGNPALAIAVSTTTYPSLKAVPLIIAYTAVRACVVLPYAFLSRRHFAHGHG